MLHCCRLDVGKQPFELNAIQQRLKCRRDVEDYCAKTVINLTQPPAQMVSPYFTQNDVW